MPIRTAVIGVGSLGRQHARLHAALAAEGFSEFVCVVDLNAQTAKSVGEERHVEYLTDWHDVVGKVDAVSLAVPTEVHCEIACGLLESGVHVLVEKPIARTLDEADQMISAAASGKSILRVVISNGSIRQWLLFDLTYENLSTLKYTELASSLRDLSTSMSFWI